jgi:hypothetical protein
MRAWLADHLTHLFVNCAALRKSACSFRQTLPTITTQERHVALQYFLLQAGLS